MNTKPSQEATYERALRLAVFALNSIELQCRRLEECSEYQEHDFHFLITALTRLRRAAKLAEKITQIESEISSAIILFDSELPGLVQMRNVLEHIDDYATEDGRIKNIERFSLESVIFSKSSMSWIGHDLDYIVAEESSIKLVKSIKQAKSKIKQTINE